jgi:hypothetical protein
MTLLSKTIPSWMQNLLPGHGPIGTFSLAAVRPLGSFLTHPHVLHKSLPKVHSSLQIRYPLVHWSHAERFLLLPEEASSRYYWIVRSVVPVLSWATFRSFLRARTRGDMVVLAGDVVISLPAPSSSE